MCKYCNLIKELYFAKPNESDIRIWWIPQISNGETFFFPVKNLEEAELLLTVLTQYDLFQVEHNAKTSYGNVGGLEIFKDGEWVNFKLENE